jgi:hypothetical protein
MSSSDVPEDSSPLGSYVVTTDKYLPTFRKIMMPSSSWSNSTDSEAEGTIILQYANNYLPVHTVKHLRRPEVSVHMFHSACCCCFFLFLLLLKTFFTLPLTFY